MALFTIPPRPQPIPVSKKCIYKTVGSVQIPIDIYLPAASSNPGEEGCPIVLYIHGGGWAGSNRSDYCRPLFQHFLSLSFIVVSMDYRLLPETSFEGQLEDVKDVEVWLRYKLQGEIRSETKVDGATIVVVGGSAGAHLALLTPKLWQKPPVAILSMCGPTNMHHLPYLGGGRLSKLDIAPPTHELLSASITPDHPPTEITLPTIYEDYLKPRGIMSLNIFREGIVAEFLLRGLVRNYDGTLSLPQKGSVPKEEIDAISPLHLLPSHTSPHPPTYQIIGTEDAIFSPSHVETFHDALERQGVECVKVLVEGKVHAFDMWIELGEDVDRGVIWPGVKWVAGFALRG